MSGSLTGSTRHRDEPKKFDAPKEYHLDVSTEYEVNRIPGGYVEVQAWQKLRLFDERDIVTLNKVEGT
jgi:hypothetical protein